MLDDSSESAVSDDSHSNDNFSVFTFNGERSPELSNSKELEENINKSKNFGSLSKLNENLGDMLKSSRCIAIPKGAKPEEREKIMEACNPQRLARATLNSEQIQKFNEDQYRLNIERKYAEYLNMMDRCVHAELKARISDLN